MESQPKVISVPDVMQNELFEILDEIFFYLVNHFDKEIVELTEEIISNMDVSAEAEEAIFAQLVWWGTFCAPMGAQKTTIYQRYLMKNKRKWKKKSLQLQKVLISWLYLNPGFYYVDNTESESGRVYGLSDVFEGKTRLLCLYNENFQVPKRGEMLTGLLLPMGDGRYTTQGGLYHIPQHLTQKVVNKIIPYFNRHATSPNYKFNPQLFPSMITLTLQTIHNQGDSENAAPSH